MYTYCKRCQQWVMAKEVITDKWTTTKFGATRIVLVCPLCNQQA